MKSDVLPNDIDQLKALLLAERALTAQLQQEKQRLLELFRLAQQKQFGKSSEGFVGQGELFNEAEEVADIVEEKKQDISYTSKKPKRTTANRLTP